MSLTINIFQVKSKLLLYTPQHRKTESHIYQYLKFQYTRSLKFQVSYHHYSTVKKFKTVEPSRGNRLWRLGMCHKKRKICLILDRKGFWSVHNLSHTRNNSLYSCITYRESEIFYWDLLLININFVASDYSHMKLHGVQSRGRGWGTRSENCRWNLDPKRSREKWNLGPKRSNSVRIGSFNTTKDRFGVGEWQKIPQKDRVQSSECQKRGSKRRHIHITQHWGSTLPAGCTVRPKKFAHVLRLWSRIGLAWLAATRVAVDSYDNTDIHCR